MHKRVRKANTGDTSSSSSDSDDLYLDTTQPKRQKVQSVLFEPYRSIGYYTSALPVQIFKSAQDTLLASVIGSGHAFFVYNTARLNLAYCSKWINEPILGIQCTSEHVFTLHATTVNMWSKMHLVKQFKLARLGSHFIATKEYLFVLSQK